MSLLDKFNSSEKLIGRDDIKEFSFSVDYLYAFSANGDDDSRKPINLNRLGKKVGRYIDEIIKATMAPKLNVIVVKTPKRSLESENLIEVLENFKAQSKVELAALKKLFRGKLSFEVLLSPHEIVVSCSNLTLKEGFSDKIIEEHFKRVIGKKNIAVKKLRRGDNTYYDLSLFYKNMRPSAKKHSTKVKTNKTKPRVRENAPIYNGNA